MVLPVYKAILDKENEEQGVSVISLVTNPAIESNFVAYNEEEYKQESIVNFNEEERIVTGAVMIPDKLILRKFNGNYCYVKFETDTIKMCHQKMMKDGNFGRFSIFHNGEEVKSITPMEIWMKTSEDDKSKSLGLGDLPVGTLFLSAHIEDDAVWSLVKEKQINGFSIESILNYQLTPMRKVIYQAVEVGSQVVVLEGEQSNFSFTGEDVTEDGTKVVIKDGKIESITPKENEDGEGNKDPEGNKNGQNDPRIDEVINRLDSQAEKMKSVEDVLSTFMDKFGAILGAVEGLSKDLDDKDSKFQETILSVKQTMAAVEAGSKEHGEGTQEEEQPSLYERLQFINGKLK